MTTQEHVPGGRTARADSQLASSAELLDVKTVAELLGGCSTRHVYRLADAGRMPKPVKLGSLIRFRRAELQAWIDAGCPGQQLGGTRP